MKMLIGGVILFVAVVIAVKVFDSEIRKEQWRKACVNFATLASLLLLISGFISVFTGK